MKLRPTTTSINYRTLLRKIIPLGARYRNIFVSLVILGVGVWAINRIGSLSQPEVNKKYLQEQLKSLQTVTFDTEAIERIQALNSSNVEIGSDFTNRNNPFGE